MRKWNDTCTKKIAYLGRRCSEMSFQEKVTMPTFRMNGHQKRSSPYFMHTTKIVLFTAETCCQLSFFMCKQIRCTHTTFIHVHTHTRIHTHHCFNHHVMEFFRALIDWLSWACSAYVTKISASSRNVHESKAHSTRKNVIEWRGGGNMCLLCLGHAQWEHIPREKTHR